ncbi:hypothetical protein EMPS_01005 [Entomortierella parvispora]|uniref:Ribosomal RNA large subunit methyltransferase K/L-like methyltransferase domain-containing protein n=1 Tax=Entomortierella parvispora TaxID=205924 RepID=A0A9P3H266_9FUNG|nr:hypothetical protein EMPS_01005 [Entomortierella parvispora]
MTHQIAMMSIELFLAVPMGLEDVVVRKLSSSLCQVATEIHYSLGSGYVIVVLPAIGTLAEEGKDVVFKTLSDLVDHPPLCIFSAHVSLGSIHVPRVIFKDPAELLALAKQKFRLNNHPSMQEAQPSRESSSPLATTTSVVQVDEKETSLHWEQALAVLKLVSPPSFTDRMDESLSTENSNDKESDPVRFRASFDRGDIQHKGVRSQDIAAALGSLAGDRFPRWKVNLTEFDVEVIGRWIQDVEETDRVYFKEVSASNTRKRARTDDDGEVETARLGTTGQSEVQPSQQMESGSKRMQVGITLPLALSACPYRFRPKDGRTSLRMEIAYTLVGLADPKPGDIVVDTCSGVGTIPIIGAAHYPQCLFLGSEILPPNVERANENSREMMGRVDLARIEGCRPQPQPQQPSPSQNSRSHSRPSLILGDAKAVCLRSSSVDLVISDLPWGQRESSHLSNCKLYPKLVKEIIRMLRAGGRAVLVTGERKLLQRQLDAPFAKPYLRVVEKREITIGFKVVAFELVRL